MSEYPATLGDLTDVETRIDARLTRLEKRQAADAEVTDEKIGELRARIGTLLDFVDTANDRLLRLETRVVDLETLWAVARENPHLVRELAAEALKGREAD